MRPRLLVIFLILVIAPLGLLGWLGVRLAGDQQRAVTERVGELLTQGLTDTRGAIARVVQQRERELVALLDAPASDTQAMRAKQRQSGLARALFAMGPDCGRVYPPSVGPWNQSEQEFVARAAEVWPDLVAICREGLPAEGVDGGTPPEPEAAGQAEQGWYVWRWAGAGAALVFWRRPPGGGLVGAEVNGIRLLADIVAALPDTGSERSALAGGRVALLDPGERVLYQWGTYEPPEGEAPRAELALAAPLSHWRLVHHLPEADAERAAGGSVAYTLLVLLTLGGLALVALAAVFYRQQAKLMREAGQRVSFVNRVSHELRTPLTNIRLYAELLQTRLADLDDKSKNQLEVIVSESGRLSRLIGNVLAFSRQQRDKLSVHPTRGVVDEVVRLALEHFGPALADKEIDVELDLAAPDEVQLDADALEQILGNLISNVEKYVPEGGRLTIRSHLEGEQTRVSVTDDGPGIASASASRVFEPFFRVSDKLTDGVSGTGLGLGIARELARLHGGDLVLAPTKAGARFELSLRTPPL